MSTFNVQLFDMQFDLNKSCSDAVRFLAEQTRHHTIEENEGAIDAFTEAYRDMVIDSTELYKGTWGSD